ncbi:YutD family protein [Paenibacillus sp.]|uniref:YutD family protein n=1 Tax=Paenibacillus sp. TaxID=58172 RepID=UPI0028123AEC|nr:YutD family protein [Paenibacillus sp.]
MIWIGGKAYELVQEYKDAWKPEAFKERYSEVLDRYDYIVGDWGYNQLRLKGFFKEGSNKGPKEAAFASVQDYLQEYCNFGCAYFILERLPAKAGAPEGTSPEEPVAEAEAVLAAPGEDGEERPEGMQRIVGVAGGMAFSDRKPYSWREHQSTSRAARNAERAAAAAATDKGEAGGRAEQGAGGPRRDNRQGGGDSRRGDGRPSGGGRSFDKPRYQERAEDGRGGPGQRPQHGGGRKFPKGPRPGGGPGGPGPGGPGGGHGGTHAKGGPGGRGGRPEGGAPREQLAGRPEGAGGGRHAHANQGGGRDRAQQRHHHKPQ